VTVGSMIRWRVSDRSLCRAVQKTVSPRELIQTYYDRSVDVEVLNGILK